VGGGRSRVERLKGGDGEHDHDSPAIQLAPSSCCRFGQGRIGAVPAGAIEIDESYFGPRRVRGQRGRGAARKIPVIGLLKREGKVFTQIAPDCSSIELLSVIRDRVRRPSVIQTDGWKAYDGLVLDGFRHHRVHHSANEFARGRRHINGIESFWSYAKTRLAKQRGIRLAKFYEHLRETEWCWNHRRENLYKFLLNETRRLPLSQERALIFAEMITLGTCRFRTIRHVATATKTHKARLINLAQYRSHGSQHEHPFSEAMTTRKRGV
jgi:transposase-like protein